MDIKKLDNIDGLLDEQMAIFPSGNQVGKAKKGVPIKLISCDLEFLHVNGVNTGKIICGLAEVDGIKYLAFFDPISLTGYVEEVHISPANMDIFSLQIIQNPEEWAVLSSFFNENNVWELKRVYNWLWSMKNKSIDSNVNKWLTNFNNKSKTVKLTKEDLMSHMNVAFDRMHVNKRYKKL